MDDFDAVVSEMAGSVAREPVTVVDFADFAVALTLGGQRDWADLIDAKLTEMMRTLGRLAKRCDELGLGRSSEGAWDALCRQRLQLLAKNEGNDELRLLVEQHEELSRLCALAKAHAQSGAQALHEMAHQIGVCHAAATKH